MAATHRVRVAHEKGLHARPASVFVQTASEFGADIRIEGVDSDDEADAKSSIGVMAMGVEPGDEIVIAAEGSDAEEAVAELAALVERDFER